MQERHFDPKAVAQKVVLFNHQGKVLIVRQSGQNKFGHTFWDLPGGRVHEGEDFEAAIRREVEEETGMKVSCLRLFRAEPGVFPSGDPNVLISYTGFARVDPKLSSEHSNFEWVDPKSLGERSWMFRQMPEWIANAPRPQSRGAMCIVENNGELLLLRRSRKVAGWAGWYYGVAGTVEDGEYPADALYRELNEELGLAKEDIEIVRAGETFKTSDYHTVFPFLVRSKNRNIRLDWEHDDAVWVKPKDAVKYNCVPFLVKAAGSLGYDMEAKADVVSCAVMRNGKLLLLKRGPNVWTHRGIWGIVAGFVEPGEGPKETALKEVEEELGLQKAQFRLVKSGVPRTRVSEGITWTMHPFMFEADTDKVSIDWEHDEYRWIHPGDVQNYETVPGLENVLDALGILKSF